MGELILETKGLTKKFRKHKAVDNVDMHIEKGSIYGFIGRNGAGKTTFMKMISGLSNPTSGSITLLGKTGSEIGSVRSKVACLIEAPGLYPNMTADENLTMKLLSAGKYSKDKVKELLHLVGLSDTGKKKSKNFSLGMKQRLGIAMTLVTDPEFLVLDEPINGLDPQGIVEVRETIHKLNTERNITILISSHILDELSRIATHYGIINNGRMLEEISAEGLAAKCTERVEIITGDTERACDIITSNGIKNITVENRTIFIADDIEDTAALNRLLVNGGIAVEQIYKKGEELESYYINLTGGNENV